jgi:hypothetical protein
MENKLVEFKTAKLAKEKGFDIQCNNVFIQSYFQDDVAQSKQNVFNGYISCINLKGICFQPEQNLLQKWIREIHKINIEIIGFVDSPEETVCYYYHLRDMTKYSTLLILPDSSENTFDTYEECLENSIYKSLTLIK